MMKFILRSVKTGCRLGSLTDLPAACSDKVIETPMCILYTKSGSVPYLGRDVLDRIQGLPAMINIPLSHVAENHETLTEYGKGIKPFCSMQDFVAYCSLQDPSQKTPSGYNGKDFVSLWGRGGKYKVDLTLYTTIMECLGAEWCQSLCDSDTDVTSTRKRVKKSVDRTLEFLDALLEKQHKSQKLQQTGLIGVIEGGHLLDERLRSARETAKRPVAGYVVEGLNNQGPETEEFQLNDVQDMLSQTLGVLPEEKPRILPGILNPANVLTAVELGFDIIDSSYPYVVSERGCALAFSCHHKPNREVTEGDDDDSTANQQQPHTWEINVKDKIYFEDFGPLVGDCSCYTCTHHTRAYVNHLLMVSELLAGVLLMVHNIHHYQQFFAVIRQSITDDTFQDFKKHILSQKPS